MAKNKVGTHKERVRKAMSSPAAQDAIEEYYKTAARGAERVKREKNLG